MSPIRMAKVESGIRVVIDLVQALNGHDTNTLKSLLSEECILEDAYPAPYGFTYYGAQAIVNHFRELFDGSPTIGWEIEELNGSGARCTLMWKYPKDHKPAASLGRRGVILFEVRQSRVCSMYSYVKGSE